MKYLLLVTLLLATVVLTTTGQVAPAGQATPATSTPLYVPNDQVATAIAKPTGGAIFSKDPAIRFGVNRRGAGEPEEHEKTSHNWVIIDGEATIIVGGTMVGRHSTGNGEFRGTDVEGGQTYQLKKGDMIRIPAGTQHWFKEVPTKTIAFYVADTLR